MTTASWLPDPFHRHELRWWDGQQWTDHVSDRGAAGIDPHHEPPAGATAWGPPTLPPPQPTGPARRPGRRGALVAAAVVAAAGLVIGGVVLFTGRNSDTAASTTTSSTSSTTTSTTSTTTTTVPPTTTMPTFSDDDLMAALPGAVDVPDGWSQYSETDRQHDPDSDSGLCLGPNSSSLALSSGSIAGADGPTFDLPDGGWFGIEAYAFPDRDAAAEFMFATIAQVTCTDPVGWSVDESWLDIFAEGFGDSAVWEFTETATATLLQDADGNITVDVAMQDMATTEVDGDAYSYRFDELIRYEQYGSAVVLYWLDGQYGFTGFSAEPEWAYQPTFDTLHGATDAVRDVIRTGLGT